MNENETLSSEKTHDGALRAHASSSGTDGWNFGVTKHIVTEHIVTEHIEGTGHAGRKRSLAKTLTWRTIATTDTILIARFITGSWTIGLGIATIEVFTKMALYYLHERGWSALDWGLEDVDVDAQSLELRPVH
jgi:uncharacterized membrane protein